MAAGVRLFRFGLLALLGCSSSRSAESGGGAPDVWAPEEAASPDGGARDARSEDVLLQGDVSVPTSGFCALPGSVVYGAGGARAVVPGGTGSADFSWLTLPDGFCVHLFGNAPHVRQIRFAPGGELFAASPSMNTQGGGPNGMGAVLVLADDDSNGIADAPYPIFLDNLPNTQGLLFAQGAFYYQDGTAIRRLDYRPGQRQAQGPGQQVVSVTADSYGLHWPKSLDVGDDGTIYVTNASDDGELCRPWRPFVGGIVSIDGTAGGRQVAKGMRNPFVVRCRHGRGDCFALELTEDYSGNNGGREKLVRVQSGADYGFPCCAAPNLPFGGVSLEDDAGNVLGKADCSGVTGEIDSWIVGRTPMGLDFEPGRWPAPFTGAAIVSMHGNFGGWIGAKVVAIDTDKVTGRPLPVSELDGGDPSAMHVFASGWDDGKFDHGRPEDATFSPDGRLFLANDLNGDIVWIAPVGLAALPAVDGGVLDASPAAQPADGAAFADGG